MDEEKVLNHETDQLEDESVSKEEVLPTDNCIENEVDSHQMANADSEAASSQSIDDADDTDVPSQPVDDTADAKVFSQSSDDTNETEDSSQPVDDEKETDVTSQSVAPDVFLSGEPCTDSSDMSITLDGISTKLDELGMKASTHERIVAGIEKEAIEIHKLYQNDIAGRIRKMEMELDSYHKRDQGLAFDNLFAEIARVYVDFEDLGEGVNDDKIKKNIQYLLEELEEVLSSRGVVRMRSEVNAKRNLSFTQVVSRISIDDPALDGCVAKSIASGFYIEKRCLIKERVDVFRFEPCSEPPVSTNE